jgi:murein DD-endopeptidase MepM/ murein hydrolase activator NlpD
MAPPDPAKVQQAQAALATAQANLAALQAPPDAQSAASAAPPAATPPPEPAAEPARQAGNSSQSSAADQHPSVGAADTSGEPKQTVAQAQRQYDSALQALKLVSVRPDPSTVATAGKEYDDAQAALTALLVQADPTVKAQVDDDPLKALAAYAGIATPAGAAADQDALLRMTGTTPGLLGPVDIERLLVAAGARDPNQITILTAIAMAESGGNPAVPNAQGSGALGLFQFTPTTAALVGLADPTNAPASAAAALRLVSQQGYGAWEAFTKGTYLRYMPFAGAGFIMPAQGPITSYFGPSHPLGIDIGQSLGLPVRAAATGVVSFSGGDPCCSYGYYVDIVHPGGFMTRYGHLMVPSFLKPGDTVVQGQIIGVSGTTGFSTGPHVHFEIRQNGVPLDPLKLLIGALPLNPLKN